MKSYPAIWQIRPKFNSNNLFQEFDKEYSNYLTKVYSENDNWNGVCLFKKGQDLLLTKLPELEKVANFFGKKNIVGINYFNLDKDSSLHEHRDMNGNLLFGIIRIHIPIKTNPEAKMIIEGKDYHIPLNSAWALDTSGLHALSNGSLDNRIHLVIDIKKSADTADYFPNLSLAVLIHLFKFIIIVTFKILRDLFTNPSSLIKRIKDKTKEFVS